jgi:hypothetical protein
MQPKTWSDISVFQWQQLTAIFTDTDNSDLDMIVKAGAVVLGKTEHEIDSWGMDRIKAMGRDIAFLHQQLDPKAVRHIEVNGRRYRCIYDVARLPAARYIESKHFGTDPNGNLHRIAASMVTPQRKLFKWGPWVDDRYDASRHSEYAEDMLAAPVTAVLGSVVFFCETYNLTMWGLRAFMIRSIMKANPDMTEVEAARTYILSCVDTDGTIRPNSWLTSSVLGSKRHMN